MATELAGSRSAVAEDLADLIRLLRSVGEDRWSGRLERIRAEMCDSEVPQRETVRQVLALFGGMGSFQDLVLQNSAGALPEQRELDRIRDRLFEHVRDIVE